MDEALDNLGQTIAGALAGSVVGHWVAHDELTITATTWPNVFRSCCSSS